MFASCYYKYLVPHNIKCIRKLSQLNLHVTNSPNKIAENVLNRMHSILFGSSVLTTKDQRLKNSHKLTTIIPNRNSKSFKKISSYFIKTGDKVKMDMSQLATLTLSELIESMNHCYLNYQVVYSSVARDILRTIESRWKILNTTKEDVLRLIFLILAYQPKVPSSFLMKNIEEFIIKNISQFSYSDLSIVSFGFFATNTKFTNYKSAANIASQFEKSIKLDDSSSVHTLYDISNILKSMRHMQYNNPSFYESIIDVLCNILKKHSDQLSHSYLSQLCSIIFNLSSLRIYHENLLKTIIKIFEASDQQIRLKDYGRLLWSLSFLRQTASVELLEKFSKYLDVDLDRGIAKLNLGAFTECLVAFCLHGFPHKKGMSALFSYQLLNIYRNKNLEQNFQISFLHSYLNLKENVEKNNFIVGNLDHELLTRQGLLSLLNSMYQYFESDVTKFKCTFILPFSTISDIELRVNSDGKIVSFNNDMNSVLDNHLKIFKNKKLNSTDGPLSNIELLLRESNIKERISYEKIHLMPKEYKTDIRKICIKIFGQNQYFINDPKLDGFHYTQLKMLQELNYEVYVIDPNLAHELDNSTDNLQILHSIFKDLVIE